MGEFNSHDHNIYYYGQKSFWRNEVTFSDLKDFLEVISKKDVLFITKDWNVKVGSQEIPGVTRKFGLE